MSLERLPSAAPVDIEAPQLPLPGRRRFELVHDALAVLTVLSVLGALLLGGFALGIADDFIRRNDLLADRRFQLTELQRTATFLVAPVHDLLEKGDVAVARATRARALEELDRMVARFDADLRQAMPADMTDQAANAFAMLRHERDMLVTTSDRVFAAAAAGRSYDARLAVADMDKRLFELAAVFGEFNRILHEVQRADFAAQRRHAETVLHLKYIVAAVVLALTIGVVAYGIRLRRQLNRAELGEARERRRAEAARNAAAEELRLSEERFSTLFYASPFSVLVADYPGGRIVNVNDAFERIFGFQRQDVIGKTTPEINLWADLRDRDLFVERLRRGEPVRDMELAFRANSGDMRTLLMSVEIVRIYGRMHSLAMSIDITERKRIERAMQALSTDLIAIQGPGYVEAAARQLALLLEAETAFVVRLDPIQEGTIRSVTLIEDGIARSDDDRPLFKAFLAEAKSGRPAIVTAQARHRFPAEALVAAEGIEAYALEPLFDHAGRSVGFLGVMSRRPLRATAALPTILGMFGVAVMAALVREQVHQRDIWLRAILDNAPIEIVLKDRDLRILAISRNVAQEHDVTPDAAVGKLTRDLMPPHIAAIYETADRNVMETGRPVDQEVKEVIDGQVRYTHNVKFPLRDEAGRTIGVGSLSADVTERKRIEEQLRQATKMEAIGKLTGGMAHDFNNYLAVIIGNLDLLKERAIDDPAARQLIDGALSGALRGAELAESLLAFSRRQPLDPEPTDVNRRLQAIATLLKRTLGEDVSLTTTLAADLWLVLLDGAQLDSGIVNLANNARDAMARGGMLTIATRNVRLDSDDLRNDPDVRPGDYVLIEIADTGAGMPPEILARAFEPFFSTKGAGHGTGLGLSMIYGFVKQSGGHIKLYSEVGRGTVVRLYLPRAVDATAAAPQDAASPDKAALPRGTESILVVEDNEDVRQTTVAQLTSLGYRVTAAENADAALALLDRAERPFDLLFTDIVMPGTLDGYALAKLARERGSGMRILLTSGFPGDTLRHNGKHAPTFTLLGKPYRREELARAIRAAIEGNSQVAAA